MTLLVLFVVLFVFLASIPFHLVLPWVFRQVGLVINRLDRPYQQTVMAKGPYIWTLVKACQFAQGYMALWATLFFFGEGWALVVAGVSVIGLQIWSPFVLFRPYYSLNGVLWGLSSFLYWPLFLICPVLFCIFALLFHAIPMAYLGTVLSLLVVVWGVVLAPIYFVVVMGVFLVLFLAFSQAIFTYFEGNAKGLLGAFEQRLS